MKFTNYTVFNKDIKEHGIEFAISHSIKLGLSSVEFLCGIGRQKIKDINDAQRIRELFEKNGIFVSCYSSGLDLLGKYSKEEILESTLQEVDYTAELGSPYFHHTFISPLKPYPGVDFSDVFPMLSDFANRVAERANKKGITCLYEPQGMYVNGVCNLRKILDSVKANGFCAGICGDIGNSLFVDTPPTEIYKSFANEIMHIHVKDYAVSNFPIEDSCLVSRSGKYMKDALPGCGAVDFEACFNYLKNYNGSISLELNATDEEIGRSINYIDKFFA
jgi:sugar phosphate isomerase/epimerase